MSNSKFLIISKVYQKPYQLISFTELYILLENFSHIIKFPSQPYSFGKRLLSSMLFHVVEKICPVQQDLHITYLSCDIFHCNKLCPLNLQYVSICFHMLLCLTHTKEAWGHIQERNF